MRSKASAAGVYKSWITNIWKDKSLGLKIMKGFRITVQQENPGQPYYTGSSVAGSLLVVVDKPKSCKHISIQFLGRADVHWKEVVSEGVGEDASSRIKRYISSETYVNTELTLWTADQSQDGRLPPGQHSFPFRFDIPPNAPSSFEGTLGSIRYTLRGRVGTSLFKFDHQIEARVPVQQVVGVCVPRLLQPVRQEVQKRVRHLLRASTPVVLTVTIPKTGYCLGETLPVHVAIENGTSRSITLNAVLSQAVAYRAQGVRRTEGKTLVSIVSDKIAPKNTREWDPTMQIPMTEVLGNGSCSIIQESYLLTVTAVIPWASNLSTSVHLKLGNIYQQPPVVHDKKVPFLSTQPYSAPFSPTPISNV